MTTTNNKSIGRKRRHTRIRKSISGTAARLRLSVYKSNRYMHAQIIDDVTGRTLLSGSTKEVVAKGAKVSRVGKTDGAKKLGIELAKKAKAAGIETVVFDRGGFRYTGRVATLANAAREGGLKF